MSEDSYTLESGFSEVLGVGPSTWTVFYDGLGPDGVTDGRMGFLRDRSLDKSEGDFGRGTGRKKTSPCATG